MRGAAWSPAASLLALMLTACGEQGSSAAPPPPGPPEPFGVMTFNVLCSFCDTANFDPWADRLDHFEDVFARYEPDLIGLQEIAIGPEVDQILERRSGFAALFYAAAESTFQYPDATILYREARFELVGEGTYWLSPTPEVPSSTGFADTMQLPRLVQWAELRDRRSRRPLYFATTHVDNNAPSQEKSAPLILERTAPFAARMPAVVVGDFNSQPDDEAFALLTEGGDLQLLDTQALATSWTVEHNQAVAPAYDLAARIDWIFVAGPAARWSVAHWAVDNHVYGPMDRYPSDHFALFAELTEVEP